MTLPSKYSGKQIRISVYQKLNSIKTLNNKFKNIHPLPHCVDNAVTGSKMHGARKKSVKI